MSEIYHKGRPRSIQLGQELKNEATDLMTAMHMIYYVNGINYARVKLVGSAVRGIADNESDFDYLIGSLKLDYDSVSHLVVVTFEYVRPELNLLTSHHIGLWFPETPVFEAAIHNQGYTRTVII